MSDYRKIVALGSSFAAGPGIDPVVDRAAMRSGRNYSHLLAARLGAQLTDLTVSGATTDTILEKSQRTVRGKRFAPQIDSVPSDADLITVTAGGNDLGYIGSMIRAGYAGWLRARPLTRPLGRALEHRSPPTATDADLAGVVAGLSRVVAAARARAPQARVVVVDYLTVLGEDRPGAAAPFTVAETEALRAIGARLSKATASAALGSDADLLQASALSANHGLGSPHPWVTGFRVTMQPMPFHPNADGMAAIADALHQLLVTNHGT